MVNYLFFNFRRVRHDIEVKAVRKTLEKVIHIAQKEKDTKNAISELDNLDLRDCIDQAKELVEKNAIKGEVKKTNQLNLFISASTKYTGVKKSADKNGEPLNNQSMAYILIVPKNLEDGDPTQGESIFRKVIFF